MTKWFQTSSRLGRRLRRCAKGAAAAEFGLTLPLMVALAFGAYDYGGALIEGIRLTGAARAGAQQAFYGSAGWDDTATAKQVALEEYVGHPLTASEIAALDVSAVADTFCGCSDGTTVSCTDTCTGGASPGRFVRVTLDTTVPLILPYPWSADGEFAITRAAVVRAR